MNSRILTYARLLAAAGAVMIATAGCSGGGGSGNDPASPSPQASSDARTAALDLAKCMRANGYPNFPDPTLENVGNGQQWIFPGSLGNFGVPQACSGQARRFKSSGSALDEQELSTADMTKLRKFASYMRENGIPDYPDPNDEGTFTITGRVRDLVRNKQDLSAQRACEKYLPPGYRPRFEEG